jgi:hypothetical protein
VIKIAKSLTEGSVVSSSIEQSETAAGPMKTGATGCPKTSLNYYQHNDA